MWTEIDDLDAEVFLSNAQGPSADAFLSKQLELIDNMFAGRPESEGGKQRVLAILMGWCRDSSSHAAGTTDTIEHG